MVKNALVIAAAKQVNVPAGINVNVLAVKKIVTAAKKDANVVTALNAPQNVTVAGVNVIKIAPAGVNVKRIVLAVAKKVSHAPVENQRQTVFTETLLMQ